MQMQMAGDEGPYQVAHARSLLRAFVVSLQNQWLP